jgi:hypothetical protein
LIKISYSILSEIIRALSEEYKKIKAFMIVLPKEKVKAKVENPR